MFHWYLSNLLRNLLHLRFLRLINNILDINLLARPPLLTLPLQLFTPPLSHLLPLNLIFPRILLSKILDIRILSAIPHHNRALHIRQLEQRFPRFPHKFVFVQIIVFDAFFSFRRPEDNSQGSWIVKLAHLARPGGLERFFQGGKTRSDVGLLHFGIGIEEDYRASEIEIGDFGVCHIVFLFFIFVEVGVYGMVDVGYRYKW